ncbi:hypothetical protein H6G97_48575 [Nostoc flagelliforme FACHB-838]|uniref:PEP-CTERM sorting domain-containing protein n=1 Tax=Nostoc flagelliforme FACHB-838 TaxID=2692904 RepID=A0ABR8E5V9_9NOSO|nr:hypothetical protein [Nostoc flagelliforme]MBD2536690.1 hypothetical protein [Nostoc flagelliforme FACHB-838]
MNNLSLATVGAVLLALGTVGKAQAVTFIDTCSTECGINGNIGPLGEGNPFNNGIPLNIGQTFTVPDTDNVLSEFSFFLSDQSSNPDVVDFRAFVIKWDESNNTPTGSIVFESTPRSTKKQNSLYPMQEFTFNTGGIELASGGKYLAFLSSLKDLDGLADDAWVGESPLSQGFDAYSGGQAFLISATDFDSIIRSSWSLDTPNADLNFKATFVSQGSTSVPEPSFVPGMLVSGVFGVQLLLKHKRNRITTP